MTDDLEKDLKTALRAKAPSAEERRAWARTAVAMAEEGGAGGRRWGRIVAATAAAAALLVAAVLLRPDRSPTPVQSEDGDAASSAENERAANDAYFEGLGDAVRTAPKGHYAVVVGGDSFRVGPDLQELLDWADKGWPRAKHRFVFPIDRDTMPLGDVVCDTGPVPETGAGLAFLDAAGLKVKGEAGAWTVEREGRTVDVVTEAPSLVVDVDGRPVSLALEGESLAPLVLPAEMLSPRFEIPGTYILEGLDRAWRKHRRHLVRVRHHSLGIDGWYGAVAAPGEWVAVRLGGHVIRGLEPGKEPKGPHFVLQYRTEDVDRLDRLFGALDELGPYERFAVPGAARSTLSLVRPGGPDSVLGEILDLDETDADALRRFLRPR